MTLILSLATLCLPIVLYSALAASIKHYKCTGTPTKTLTWGRATEKPEGYLVKVSLKIV